MSTADEIESMLTDCEERESKLSDWEREFISDLVIQVGRGGSLTQKQDEKLEQIWERITA